MVSIKESAKKDLSVNIAGLNLKNPFITASGTYGYADEYEEFVNLQNVGAIITKGITLNPRSGNPQPRLGEVKNGLINSIGLENVGISAFIEKKLPVLLDKKIEFIVNVAGFSINEYVEIARICEVNSIPAIELNVSCPNVKDGCLEFAKDKDMLAKVISEVRNVFYKTLIVKLSPNVSGPSEIALTAQEAGADAVSAINTVKAMKVSTRFKEGKLEYSHIKGGMSGSVVKPVALAFIHEIKQVIHIPIIGLGGVCNIQDALDFIAVGAQAVQVGTANFTYPEIMDKLSLDLEKVLNDNNINSYSDLIKGL